MLLFFEIIPKIRLELIKYITLYLSRSLISPKIIFEELVIHACDSRLFLSFITPIFKTTLLSFLSIFQRKHEQVKHLKTLLRKDFLVIVVMSSFENEINNEFRNDCSLRSLSAFLKILKIKIFFDLNKIKKNN